MSGKGDTPRPVDPQKWDANWRRIFARCELRNPPASHTLHQPHEEGHGESGPAEG